MLTIIGLIVLLGISILIAVSAIEEGKNTVFFSDEYRDQYTVGSRVEALLALPGLIVLMLSSWLVDVVEGEELTITPKSAVKTVWSILVVAITGRGEVFKV